MVILPLIYGLIGLFILAILIIALAKAIRSRWCTSSEEEETHETPFGQPGSGHIPIEYMDNAGNIKQQPFIKDHIWQYESDDNSDKNVDTSILEDTDSSLDSSSPYDPYLERKKPMKSGGGMVYTHRVYS